MNKKETLSKFLGRKLLGVKTTVATMRKKKREKLLPLIIKNKD